MLIPPVTVYGNSLEKIQSAIEQHLDSQCIRQVFYDENRAYVQFKKVDTNEKIKLFMDHLITGITITYDDNAYHVFLQYI